jgi:hypothetical protein
VRALKPQLADQPGINRFKSAENFSVTGLKSSDSRERQWQRMLGRSRRLWLDLEAIRAEICFKKFA